MLWRVALLVTALAQPATAADITAARYTDPTTRYAHGVLGDAVEWGALEFTHSDGLTTRIVLPEDRVFEDLAPRLYDVDQDGTPEAVVVESHLNKGARLAIYGADGLIDATPYIGTRHRWLAPFAIADMDGDGAVELAYVDRPHLAKTLRVWRYDASGLLEVASLGGVTNHRIGQDFISGGLRTCGPDTEMVLANSNWTELIAIQLEANALTATPIGPFTGPDSWADALRC